MEEDSEYSLGLINGKVYHSGRFDDLNIYVRNQVIAKISFNEEKFHCKKEIDCSGKLVLPGFIDPHVHINLNLGEFKTCDNYESASTAAAFGGVTTFIDFLEPIFYVSEFEEKLKQKQEEAKKSYIDYSFHTTIGNFKEDARKLIEKSISVGIPSIKLFTTYSESNRRCPYPKIREFIANSALIDTLILIHAENDEIIQNAQVEDTLFDYENSRPATAEITEIHALAQITSEVKGKVYIVHVNCGSSLELLKDKYLDLLGNNLFIESCPQYFNLTKDVFESENGNLYLLAPPLRSKEEQNKLKDNIYIINTIGTDHAPFMKEEKFRYDQPSKIPKGLGSLEYSFSLMYNLFGDEIIPKFTVNPAIIHYLFPKKGILREGSDADIVIFDPEKEFTINSGHSQSDYSPYEDMKVKGLVESTILRGEFIVQNRKLVGSMNGQFIWRK